MSSRLLIDSNMIQTPELEAFLASDPGNRAVVAIEIWFELYKQRSLDGLRRGLDIMGRYPDQLVVLRATGETMRLDPSVPDLLRRMALPDAALSMRQMAHALAPERGDDPDLAADLTAKWDEAADQNRSMIEGAIDIILSLPEMQEHMFNATEIGIIRRNERYTQPMFGSIFYAAEQMLARPLCGSSRWPCAPAGRDGQLSWSGLWRAVTQRDPACGNGTPVPCGRGRPAFVSRIRQLVLHPKHRRLARRRRLLLRPCPRSTAPARSSVGRWKVRSIQH